jgi:hypothetical protein
MQDDVKQVDVERPEGGFVLTKAEDGWKVTVDGETAPAIENAATALTGAAANLEAESVLFGQEGLKGEPAATVRVQLEAGTTHVIQIGADADGAREAFLSGRNVTFTLSALDAAELLPELDALREEAPPAEDEAAAEADEEQGESADAGEAETADETAAEAEG